VLVTIAELLSVDTRRPLTIPHARLRLASGIRQSQSSLLLQALTDLQAKYGLLSDWRAEDDTVTISVSDEFPSPDISELDLEVVLRKQIRRALLFKLYDLYCEHRDRFFTYPLVESAGEIGLSREDIFEQVLTLQSDGYLEYGVCDGGACTSSLTGSGIALCENRALLFRELAVLHVRSDYEERQQPSAAPEYVSKARIGDIKSVASRNFDLKKLVRLCEELNTAHQHGCFYSMAYLLRAIVDHVPSIFGCTTFEAVANNHANGRSWKELMLRLNEGTRKIADMHLHQQARSAETLPDFQQVNYMGELDALLCEVLSALRKA
jgi:hypothetical protein